MAVAPATATPIPKPTIPCSHKGVLKTLSLPIRKKKKEKKKKHTTLKTSVPLAHQLSVEKIAPEIFKLNKLPSIKHTAL